MSSPSSFGSFGRSPLGTAGACLGDHRIFIGFDTSQREAYHVLCHSLLKHASIPVTIYALVLSEFQAYTSWWRRHDPLQSTEFTYLRFAVPWLCDYKGTALFMDSDMLCRGDIAEIFGLSMGEYALRVVKHDHQPVNQFKMGDKVQTVYPRKNWSSMMLMDCSKLTLWGFDACNDWSGKQLHRFEGIPDEQIAELPLGWNVLDHYDEHTKLIHYTEGGPWLPGFEKHPFGDIWFEARQEAISNSYMQVDLD